MQTISNIEVVFTDDNGRYVVEYDFTYDAAEFYVDVIRIEAISAESYVTKQAALKAFEIAHGHAYEKWAEQEFEAYEA